MENLTTKILTKVREHKSKKNFYPVNIFPNNCLTGNIS